MAIAIGGGGGGAAASPSSPSSLLSGAVSGAASAGAVSGEIAGACGPLSMAQAVGCDASAANAAIDHVRNWVQGTPAGDWVSMGIPSDGSYGIPEGVIFGYPVTCQGGKFEIVKGIELSDFSKQRIALTHQELQEERDGVKTLLG